MKLLSESTGQQGGMPFIIFPPPSPPPPPPPPPALPPPPSPKDEGEGEESLKKEQEGEEEEEAREPILLLSPLDTFMASNVFYENKSHVLQYGVQGKVEPPTHPPTYI